MSFVEYELFYRTIRKCSRKDKTQKVAGDDTGDESPGQ